MRPSFLLTKKERRESEMSLDVSGILDRYRRIQCGMFHWSGLPDGCPSDFVEETIFDHGPVSAKHTAAYGDVVMAASASTLDIYGHPYSWLPTVLNGMSGAPGDDLFDPSETPVLWIGSTAERIKPYADLLSSALGCLDQNLISMESPIVVAGNVGNELEGLTMMDDLGKHKRWIPACKNPGAGVQVLDLRVQDHTQNLISTIRAMDSEILSVMGVSNGTEKSSGVTDVETLSTVQELTMVSIRGLQLRQEWCEQINAALGTSIRCEFGDGYSMPQETISNDEPDKEVTDDADIE